MNWGAIFLSTLTILIIIIIQWKKLKKNPKKEKIAFLMLTGFGWLLANTLIIFPELPGPTQVIEYTFKPFGKLLE